MRYVPRPRCVSHVKENAVDKDVDISDKELSAHQHKVIVIAFTDCHYSYYYHRHCLVITLSQGAQA